MLLVDLQGKVVWEEFRSLTIPPKKKLAVVLATRPRFRVAKSIEVSTFPRNGTVDFFARFIKR